MSGKVYKIGSVSMSHQAFLIVLAGTCLSALMFIGGIVSGHRSIMIGAIISALIFMGVTFYNAYIVNCAIVGKCDKLAWFLTAIYMFVGCTYLIALVKSFGSSQPMSAFPTPSYVSAPMSLVKSKGSKSKSKSNSKRSKSSKK